MLDKTIEVQLNRWMAHLNGGKVWLFYFPLGIPEKVSHHLRYPLGVVRFRLQLLLEKELLEVLQSDTIFTSNQTSVFLEMFCKKL